jgi:YaiO family outer membrane protein
VRGWLFALPLAALAAPAAAQTPEQLYETGVAERRAGNHERAAELLTQAVAAQPRNSDALVQQGLALLALNRLDEAEAAFRRVVAIAPDYADARIGLARVQQRRGYIARAIAELDPVPRGNVDADELRSLLTAGAEPDWRWRFDIDGSYSTLTEDQPDWRETAFRVTHQPARGTSISGGLEISRRFGETDAYGELRLEQRWGNRASAYVLLGGTPNADYRPEWQIGAGGLLRIRGGAAPTMFALDARQARYPVGDIQTLNPGVEQYLASGRLWINARWINIFDEDGRHHSGWLVRGDAMASERVRLFVGAADAPDVSEGVVTDTFSLFGGLSYDVDERTTLRASLARHDRESGYDRLEFGLGAGFRF